MAQHVKTDTAISWQTAVEIDYGNPRQWKVSITSPFGLSNTPPTVISRSLIVCSRLASRNINPVPY